MIRSWLYSLLGLAGFLVGAYILLTYALPLILPFAIALTVAELIEPVVSRLTWKGKVPRVAAVGVVLFLFVGLFVTGVTVAVARLVKEISDVVAQLPYMYDLGVDIGTRIAKQFGAFHASLPPAMQAMVAEHLQKVKGALGEVLPKVAESLTAVGGVTAFFTNMIVAFIATFFISRDKAQISAFLLRLFPVVWRDKLRKVKTDVWASTMGFAKAQLMLIFLTMVQTIIGLTVIDAKYSVTIGILVGVADVLPLLGPAAVFVPWILYSFIFGSKVFGIKLLVLYAIVAGVRQVLEAKVVGEQIGLHPLAILLSVYLGFHFFGGLGFIVGPLLAILLKSMIHSGLLPIFQDDPPA